MPHVKQGRTMGGVEASVFVVCDMRGHKNEL